MTPWRDHAPNVARNGFSPVVVGAGTKRPRFREWDNACGGQPNLGFIKRHAGSNPTDSVGLACGILRDRAGESLGRLFVIDIDTDSWAEADRIEDLAFHHLGETRFVRSRPNGPRRILLYRTEGRVKSGKLDGAEILAGGMFVAFGLHPSGVAYAWSDASPANTPASEVPLVTRDALDAFRRAAGAKIAKPRPSTRIGIRKGHSAPADVLETVAAGGVGRLRWTNAGGRVSDGREAFLTWCVGKAGGDAARAWRLFSEHAALGRAKGSNVSLWWSVEDAEAKAKAWRKNAERRRDGVRATGRPRASHRKTLTSEQRQAHVSAAERAHREGRIGATAVQLSAAMLDFADGQLGSCTASLSTLGSAIGRGRSTVANARNELDKAGLWKHLSSGVYSPILSDKFFKAQPADSTKEMTPAVQHPPGPKVSVGVWAPSPPTVRHHRPNVLKWGIPEWGTTIESLRLGHESVASALATMRIGVVGTLPVLLQKPNPFRMKTLNLYWTPTSASQHLTSIRRF